MIRLYVASGKTGKRGKRHLCQISSSGRRKRHLDHSSEGRNGSLDDCEISDVECDVEEAQEFLCSLEISRVNIFELNDFCWSSFCIAGR